MRRSSQACVVAFLVVGGAADDARADEPVPNILPPPDHGARTLRGHTFIEPTTQHNAFVTSHIGVRQGVAYFSVPGFPISADVRADLAIFALEERLELQIRILPWLGLYAAGEAVVASGLDTASFFYGNSGFLAGGRGGPVFRLFRSRVTGTQVSLRGHVGGAAGNSLTLPSFVQAIAVRASRAAEQSPPTDANEATRRLSRTINTLSNAVVGDESVFELGGSLHLAQTVVRMVGLQASFGVSRRLDSDDRFDPFLQARSTVDGAESTVRFAAALSVDAYHVHVPVAVLGEYALEKSYRVVEGTDVYVPSAHYFGVGSYYSGRTDLQLGLAGAMRRNLKPLEATALDGTKAMTGQPTELHGQFVLRYVWN